MKRALAVFLCIAPLLMAQTPDANSARVFITDSQSWSIAGSGGGANGAFGSTVAGGARPQTAEIIKTFGQRCPQVVINNIQTKADYIVLLDHEGGKGALRHKNKVAVFNRVSGDSIVSKSTLSLGGSVQDACEAITSDWAAHGKEIRAASAPPPAAQPAPAPAPDHVGTGASPVQAEQSPAAAAAQLQVTSTPDAADIEIDGSFVGNTPSTVGVAAGQHQISVKKSGFKPWERKITVSSGQVNVNAVLEAESK
ncbi:MAG: PEGA domain-containing protein [Terriglobales bacterium]